MCEGKVVCVLHRARNMYDRNGGMDPQIIQSCTVYISIYTYSHETQLYIISSDIQYATTCLGPVCRPSSGCPENLSDYTVCVVLFCGGGRDLVLQHES